MKHFLRPGKKKKGGGKTRAKSAGRRRKPAADWKEAVPALLAAEGLIFLIYLLCYGDAFWLLPLQTLLLPFGDVWKKGRKARRRREYENGFHELLQSMMASLQAGYSIENACRVAKGELEEYYGRRRHPMVRRLQEVVHGIELHIPVNELFRDMAEETGVDEIYQFAVVLDIVKETGGNMMEIMRNSMEHIEKRLSAREEIQVILSGKIFEKNIMLLMPFLILVYLRLTNPGYMSCFYDSIAGHLIMSGILAAVIGCFYWSEKIMRIDV